MVHRSSHVDYFSGEPRLGDSSSVTLSGLPDSRQSLLGFDAEGDEVWLIRGISQKQYTCPGCYGTSRSARTT